MNERIPRFAPGDRVDFASGAGNLKWTEGVGGRIREVLGFAEDGEIRWRYQVAWPVKEGVKVMTQLSWSDAYELVPHGVDPSWAVNWLAQFNPDSHECGGLPQGGITIRAQEEA